MDTHKLEETTDAMDTIRWSAIASGTAIALAVQTVLLLLGFAFATSVGDRIPGAGFGVWMVIVELIAIAIGAALTARMSHALDRRHGIAAGIMTWAVTLVLGAVFEGLAMTRGIGGTGAWAGFIGALISLVAAVLGGAFGASLGHGSMPPPRRDVIEDHVAPVH